MTPATAPKHSPVTRRYGSIVHESRLGYLYSLISIDRLNFDAGVKGVT